MTAWASRLLPSTLLIGLLATVVANSATAQIASHDTKRGVLPTLFRFSGAVDSGEQVPSSGEAATSVVCTNFGSDSAMVEVEVTDFDGTAYSGLATLDSDRTRTFSTHGTSIFIDDIIIGGSPGTPALDQGGGEIRADGSQVVCTALVVDPANSPPVFMSRLWLRRVGGGGETIFEDGFESGNTNQWDTTTP